MSGQSRLLVFISGYYGESTFLHPVFCLGVSLNCKRWVGRVVKITPLFHLRGVTGDRGAGSVMRVTVQPVFLPVQGFLESLFRVYTPLEAQVLF